MKYLILGSSSSYRQKLLARLGYSFTVIPPNLDEELEKQKLLAQNFTPLQLAQALAERKAESVQELINNQTSLNLSGKEGVTYVIGADQLLTIDGKILGKPLTVTKAVEMLKMLQGREHLLISAVALLKLQGGIKEVWAEVAHMKMRSLTDKEIETYVQLDQPLWSAGSYKIESFGIQLFDEIRCADWTAIEGLPLLSLSKKLRQSGDSG
ncbi:MAG: Maf family protein [Bdellovibrionaceae bacterium]|nr:Maf family protein [Pseudobdellovibrionaceae bacterium]MDW8189650.1 nucleoside triphosphate pyrophosphatase [Pseudobdellovibrionaceae bacterium]